MQSGGSTSFVVESEKKADESNMAQNDTQDRGQWHGIDIIIYIIFP
jgi:hypothetical protein